MEFDGTVFVNTTMTEEAIKQAVFDFIESTGTNAKVVSVVVDVDSQGRVSSVVVDVVCDDNTAQTIVTTINQQIKKGDGCDAGVLCRITNAVVQPLQPSDNAPPPPTTTTSLCSLLVCISLCVNR